MCSGRPSHPHSRRATALSTLGRAEGESDRYFSPGAAGGPSLVARITAEEWQSLAQQGERRRWPI